MITVDAREGINYLHAKFKANILKNKNVSKLLELNFCLTKLELTVITDRRSEKNVVNKKNSRFINLFSFDKMYLLQLQNKP